MHTLRNHSTLCSHHHALISYLTPDRSTRNTATSCPGKMLPSAPHQTGGPKGALGELGSALPGPCFQRIPACRFPMEGPLSGRAEPRALRRVAGTSHVRVVVRQDRLMAVHGTELNPGVGHQSGPVSTRGGLIPWVKWSFGKESTRDHRGCLSMSRGRRRPLTTRLLVPIRAWRGSFLNLPAQPYQCPEHRSCGSETRGYHAHQP